MTIRCSSFSAALKKAKFYADEGVYAVVKSTLYGWIVEIDID